MHSCSDCRRCTFGRRAKSASSGSSAGACCSSAFSGSDFFVAAVQTFLLPWVYEKASCTLGCHLLSTSDGPPLYGWFYVIEELATFLGLILLGLSIARARVASGAGYLMALSGVLSLPLAFIAVAPLVAAVPELLALLAVSWIALRFLTGESP